MKIKCLLAAIASGFISVNANADVTDLQIGPAQIFDVQYSYNGTTLNVSNMIAPYASVWPGNFQHPTATAGQYYAFFNSVTVPGTYALGLYDADGTLAHVIHNTGTLSKFGDGLIFYIGNGFFGTVITTGQGYSYGSSASFANTYTPTPSDIASYTPPSSTPLTPGQVAMTDITTLSNPSEIGNTLNPRFNGGTLKATTSATHTANISITSSNGTIDQNDLQNTYSGNFTDDSLGANGRLIIENSGTNGIGYVRLTGTNSYSGGTEVRAGATLSIASSGALGTGGLDLIGSATVPATLETTADMTIGAPITVSGDPVFSVASGTTLTVSTPITDGGSAGDVVVDGGGTLNLTAANTYTGQTTINSGSTLALTGNTASITPSSAVTNNGTADFRSANPTTVAIGGSYSQGSTGTLRMVAAPGSFQRLTVGGTATLAGSLDLTASAGNYPIGRYVLINATGGRTGNFSTFTNNLSSVTGLGYLLGYSTNQVYLDLTPATNATLQQIAQNADSLRSLINTQASVLQTALTYDCTVFDANNLCISAGGRYSNSGEGSIANTGGLLVLGYRPTTNTRIAIFADQSLEINSPAKITQSKSQPTWGITGNWAPNADGNGINIHGSAVFSSSDLTIKRAASATTEGGQGQSSFDGQAYELQVNYVKPLSDNLTAVPFIGLRYTRIDMDAYSEEATSQTAWPINYRGMVQEAFSAIAGANFSLRLTEKLTTSAGLGIQQNLNYKMDSYSGTSDIPGLASFSMPMADKSDTLAMVRAGATYGFSKKERVAVNALWQQQPSYSKGTNSLMVTWSLGF